MLSNLEQQHINGVINLKSDTVQRKLNDIRGFVLNHDTNGIQYHLVPHHYIFYHDSGNL